MHAPNEPQPALLSECRLEVAWTVAGRAAGGAPSYASAVLVLSAEWTSGTRSASSGVLLKARLVSGNSEQQVALPSGAALSALRRGRWMHVRITAASDTLMAASFENGRLVYCSSRIPECAELGGATYDMPSGTLDWHDGMGSAPR